MVKGDKSVPEDKIKKPEKHKAEESNIQDQSKKPENVKLYNWIYIRIQNNNLIKQKTIYNH